MIGSGLSTLQIAEAMYISPGTVSTYRSRIKSLVLENSAELVHCAVKWVQDDI